MISALALECHSLRKQYAPHDSFVLGSSGDGLSLSVARGEMFALLGPSGCGKTTTLRIIGGFVQPDAGRVLIDGVDYTDRPPYARPTNTVFQSYALFPHLSVGANVAFGLTMERVRRRDKNARVAEALEMVGLAGYQRRRVSELSGGQQQRAALARAIVKRPSVLLLDEPLGALDLQLRKQMQDELAGLKAMTSTTFVHVTHDQEEACAIADRIAVMKDGAIVQVDAPFALYQRPRTTFVANFLDAGTIVRGATDQRCGIVTIAGPSVTIQAPATHPTPDAPLAAVIPNDKIRVSQSFPGNAAGAVTRIVFTGTTFRVHVDVDGCTEFKVNVGTDQMKTFDPPLHLGTRVYLTWHPDDIILVADDDGTTAPAGSTSTPPLHS